MSKHCCVPECASIGLTSSLCHVPSKKFCSGEKYNWADKLERIIFSIRDDDWIRELYKRDQVKICLKHFREEDQEKRGPLTILKIGAMPVFQLPEKRVPGSSTQEREQSIESRIYHQNWADVRKNAEKYLPQDWEMEDKDNVVHLYMKSAAMERVHSTDCCVPLCTSSRIENPELSFHCIPFGNTKRLRKWIISIRRVPGENFKMTRSTKVCSKHFRSEDFTEGAKSGRRLRGYVVPSIFEWTKNEITEQKEIKSDHTQSTKRCTKNSCEPYSTDLHCYCESRSVCNDHNYCYAWNIRRFPLRGPDSLFPIFKA